MLLWQARKADDDEDEDEKRTRSQRQERAERKETLDTGQEDCAEEALRGSRADVARSRELAVTRSIAAIAGYSAHGTR